MSEVVDLVVVGAAGLVAGAVNAVAGGGTLISFPALLATGQSALVANITSSVGLLTGYLGGSVAYREELRGQGPRVRRLGVAALVGGVAGAVLLLVTPPGSFEVVVPYLVLLAVALLAVQPRLARAVAARRGAEAREGDGTDLPWATVVLIGLGAVYGSYFGAGLGVMMLAVLGILVDDGLQRLNALKGVLSLLVNVIGVVIFLFSGKVAWASALVLAVTAYAGGTLGVAVARRLPVAVLRWSVLVLGVVVAVVLIVT